MATQTPFAPIQIVNDGSEFVATEKAFEQLANNITNYTVVSMLGQIGSEKSKWWYCWLSFSYAVFSGYEMRLVSRMHGSRQYDTTCMLIILSFCSHSIECTF